MGLCVATGLLVLASVTLSTEQITQFINAIGGETDGSVAAWIRAWTLWALFLVLLTLMLISGLL